MRTYDHPCDAIDEFIAKINEVPGVNIYGGEGIAYSARRLRSLYDYVREQLPVRVGDRVKINENVTYGDSQLTVAGREGVVRHIDWNSHWEYWQVTVEMSALYTTVHGEPGATRKKLFSFAPDQMAVV